MKLPIAASFFACLNVFNFLVIIGIIDFLN